MLRLVKSAFLLRRQPNLPTAQDPMDYQLDAVLPREGNENVMEASTPFFRATTNLDAILCGRVSIQHDQVWVNQSRGKWRTGYSHRPSPSSNSLSPPHGFLVRLPRGNALRKSGRKYQSVQTRMLDQLGLKKSTKDCPERPRRTRLTLNFATFCCSSIHRYNDFILAWKDNGK